jgi:hypothetical protein
MDGCSGGRGKVLRFNCADAAKSGISNDIDEKKTHIR